MERPVFAKTEQRPAGENFVWLSAMGLSVGLLMVVGLLAIILRNGLAVFWPDDVQIVEVANGYEAPVTGPERFAGILVDERQKAVPAQVNDRLRRAYQREQKFFIGNQEYHGNALFQWVDADAIVGVRRPASLMVAERWADHDMIFEPVGLTRADGSFFRQGDAAFVDEVDAAVAEAHQRRDALNALRKQRIGEISRSMDRVSTELSVARRENSSRVGELETKLEDFRKQLRPLKQEAARLEAQLRGGNDPETGEPIQAFAELHFQIVGGERASLAVGELVKIHRPNAMNLLGKAGYFIDEFFGFLLQNPRDANFQGGIFPAIVGSFIMTVLMSVMVMPFGVLAAIYLREYARQGPLVRAIRISVNNLAGVPSIVYGVFGLGFFIYIIGDWVDHGPAQALAPGWWFLGGFLNIAILFFGALLPSFGRSPETGATARWQSDLGALLVMAGFLGGILLIFFSPYFEGFFADKNAALNRPTFGTGGILWASLTLALMTVPVVVVATEEALASVPLGMREAALACGASKWQTVQKVVLPAAAPGVLTGMILAMARGAGEVAPLMLVGVVKSQEALPVDGSAPFVHLERKFMHLGFHLYDLAFQSPDAEAARPLLFATTLFLIMLVLVLNLGAIIIRERLRRRYTMSTF